MSKQDELLEWLGRYHDGLSVRDLQRKLPLRWFMTNDHNKEVRNALEQLKRKGLAKSVDIGNGVNHWVKDEGAKEPDTKEGQGGPAENGMDALDDGAAEGAADVAAGEDASSPAIAEAIAAVPGVIEDLSVQATLAHILEAELKHGDPGIEFHGQDGPIDFNRPRPTKVEGIRWVWAAETEDGQLFPALPAAVAHRDSIRLDKLLQKFEEECGPATSALIEGIKIWEKFKRGRAHA